jgi:nitronate monooxygenase
MALRTVFTDMMSIRHPIALAPMGGAAGGALAAAVSNAGGLGLVGGGRGGRGWLERELGIVRSATTQPWGVGFLAWAAPVSAVEWALEQGPHALMLSFGDPGPFAARVRAAGVPLFVQVTTLAEARRAMDVGADVIIAQGSEAGGHGGARSTLPFVPSVVDLVAPTPVLAAGGIADGRGVAAALMLGAVGALVGTRFQATHEALVPAEISKALVDGHGADTERTRILDIAHRAGWPAEYTARVLTNPFLEQWRGREAELAEDEATQHAYAQAAKRNDLDAVSVWASEALDLIADIAPAAELTAQLARDAEHAIARIATGDDRR